MTALMLIRGHGFRKGRSGQSVPDPLTKEQQFKAVQTILDYVIVPLEHLLGHCVKIVVDINTGGLFQSEFKNHVRSVFGKRLVYYNDRRKVLESQRQTLASIFQSHKEYITSADLFVMSRIDLIWKNKFVPAKLDTKSIIAPYYKKDGVGVGDTIFYIPRPRVEAFVRFCSLHKDANTNQHMISHKLDGVKVVSQSGGLFTHHDIVGRNRCE
jgi:hypothetical protein